MRSCLGQLVRADSFARFAAFAAALCLGLAHLRCAQAAPETDDAGTAFREVFVPADRPADWPTGQSRYLPIDQEEFASLVRRARRQTPNDPDKNRGAEKTEAEKNGANAEQSDSGKLAVQADVALHRASWAPGEALTGGTQLQIRLVSDRPQRFALNDFTPAIELAAWESNPQAPVQIGLWNDRSASPELTYGLLVSQSDQLNLSWSALGQSRGAAGVEFEFSLTHAARQQLELILPIGYTPQLPTARLAEQTRVTSGTVLWRYWLSPGKSHRLSIVPDALPAVATSPAYRVRQSQVYRISPTGLVLESTLHVTASKDVSSLSVEMSEALDILKATINDQPVAWRQTGDNRKSVLIELPAGESQYTAVLTAAAPLIEGRAWRLPTLRPAEEAWSEETLTLQVDPRLELISLQPSDATLLSASGVSPTSSEPETHRFQSWNASARLEAIVQQRTRSFRIDQYTLIEAGESAMASRAAVTIHPKGAPQYRAAANLRPGWQIESVESEPAADLMHWRVEGPMDSQRLELQFRRAPDATAPVRLIIDAQRPQGDLGESTPVVELRWLKFLRVAVQREWIAIQNRQDAQSYLAAGLQGARLSSSEVDPLEFGLQQFSPSTLLFDVTDVETDAVLSSQLTQLEFDGNAVVEAAVRAKTCDYRVQLHFQIDRHALSELLVLCSQPLPENAHWRTGDRQQVLAAERVQTPEHTPFAPVAYRVLLPSPQTESFTIDLDYQRPRTDQDLIDNFIAPAARQWQSWAVVRGQPDDTIVAANGCLPVAPPLAGSLPKNLSATSPPLLAALRFNLEQPLNHELAPTIARLRRPADHADRPILCTQLDLATACAGDGRQAYSLEYSLLCEAWQDKPLAANFTLPAGARLAEVFLDGQTIPKSLLLLQQNADANHANNNSQPSYVVNLPAHSQATLALRYLVKRAPLHAGQRLAAQLPEVSFPVLQGEWTFWTPEPFATDSPAASATRASSESWQSRLLGPLCRGRSTPLFNPLEAEDWISIGRGPLQRRKAILAADRLARRLKYLDLQADLQGDLNGDPNDGSSADGEASDLLNALPVGYEVLFDQIALERAWAEQAEDFGVQSSDGQIRPAAQNAIGNIDYQIVADPSTLIVTTAARLAFWRSRLDPIAGNVVFYTPDSSALTSEIDVAAAPQFPRQAPAETRRESLAIEPEELIAGPSRWQAATYAFAAAPVEVSVRYPTRERSVWLAIWLVATVAAAWLFDRRAKWILYLLAGSAVLCLLVPLAWLTPPQAIFLGCLTGCVVRAAYAYAPSGGNETLSTIIHKTPTFLLLFLQVAVAAIAGASAEAAPPAVLIPSGAEGQPLGDEIYVPEKLLKAIRYQAMLSETAGADWALTGGRYAIQLAKAGESGGLTCSELLLAFRLQTFVDDVAIRLPLKQQQAEWFANRQTLDGGAVETQWSEDSFRLELRVPLAGVHELRLYAAPPIVRKNKLSHLQLDVPRLPAARLEIFSPATLKSLVISSAAAPTESREGETLVTTLAATNQLQLAWQPTLDPAIAGLRVEQFERLSCTPQAVTGSVQLALSGRLLPTLLPVETSRPMRLLPLAKDAAVQVVGDADSGYALKFDSQATLPLHVTLPFEIQRDSPYGQIHYPRFSVPGVKRGRRLFAADVDSRLQFSELSREDLRVIAPTEFSKLWQGSEKLPKLAYSVHSSSPVWMLEIHPQHEPLALEQRLDVLCHTESAKVKFIAQLLKDSPALTYQFALPSGFKIRDVWATDSQSKRRTNLRWSQGPARSATLFLSSPLRAKNEIHLVGQIPYAAPTELSLPIIAIAGAEQRKLLVTLGRDSETSVRWQQPERLPAGLLGEGDAKSGPLPTGAFELDYAQADAPLLQVASEKTMFTATTATLLLPNSQVDLIVNLQVQQGSLDQLEILTSDDWEAVDAASAAYRIARLPQLEGMTQRRYALLLSAPLRAGETATLAVQGKLALAADQRRRAPNLHIAAAIEQQRFLVLPSVDEGQPVDWRVRGLQHLPLPEQLAAEASRLPNGESFFVVRDSFSAEQRVFPTLLREAAIRLAEMRVVLDGNGAYSATAQFVLQPGKAASCQLRLPGEAQLLRVTVGGQPIALRGKLGQETILPLGPPHMPLEIVATYRQAPRPASGSQSLAPPQLVIGDRALALPTVRWSLAMPKGQDVQASPQTEQIQRAAFERAGLDARREVVVEAEPLAMQMHPWEAKNWFLPWYRELGKTPAAVAAPLLGQNEANLSQTLATARWEALCKRFVTSDEAASQQKVPVAGMVLEGRQFYQTSAGQSLTLSRVQASFGWQRWFMCITAITVIYIAVCYRRYVVAGYEYLKSRPRIALLLIGGIWWLLLSPSLLGLLMMCAAAASLALTTFHALRRRSRLTAGSTITHRTA